MVQDAEDQTKERTTDPGNEPYILVPQLHVPVVELLHDELYCLWCTEPGPTFLYQVLCQTFRVPPWITSIHIHSTQHTSRLSRPHVNRSLASSHLIYFRIYDGEQFSSNLYKFDILFLALYIKCVRVPDWMLRS